MFIRDRSIFCCVRATKFTCFVYVHVLKKFLWEIQRYIHQGVNQSIPFPTKIFHSFAYTLTTYQQVYLTQMWHIYNKSVNKHFCLLLWTILSALRSQFSHRGMPIWYIHKSMCDFFCHLLNANFRYDVGLFLWHVSQDYTGHCK